MNDSERKFMVHTGERGYELFHKSFVRGVRISTFNMMHEMNEIDGNTWESVNSMLSSPDNKDIEMAHSIIEFYVKTKENENECN